MAVYGNIALATDHTIFKAIDASGKLAVHRRSPRAADLREGKRKVASGVRGAHRT